MTQMRRPTGHVDPRDLQPAERLEWRGRELPERDAGDDAEEHPQRQPALEEADRRSCRRQ